MLSVAVSYLRPFDPLRGFHVGAFGVVEPLLDINDEGKLIPKLVVDWEQINDNEWRFYIRKGVICHDGSMFSSDTVKFSIERMLNNRNGGWVFPPIDYLTIEDDYTFIIRLEHMVVLLPYYLARINVIAHSSLDDQGNFIKPVGTGPFIFKKGEKNKYMQLEANYDYWDDVPKIKKLLVNEVKEPKERVQMLEKGEVDVITEVLPEDITRLRGDKGIKVALNHFPYTHQLLFNTKKWPFNDQKVRQAVNYAIDRESVVKNVLEDIGTIAFGPFPSTFPGISQNLKRYDYNPGKAQYLLAKAGWKAGDDNQILEKDGKKFEATLLVYSYRAELPYMAQVLKEQLKNIGIEVNVKILTMEKLNSIVARNEHELVLSGRAVGSMPDPYAYLTSDFSSTGRNNKSCYSANEVDNLLESARAIADSTKRFDVYNDVLQIIMRDAPVAFISHDVLSAACNAGVKGFGFDSIFGTSYTVSSAEIVKK